MPFDHARLYLARVLHWPDANEEPAYANIHWTFTKPGEAKPLWAGRAVRSVNDGVKALDWALNKATDVRDVYLCLSTQRQANEKISAKGWKYYAPIRNQPNAVRLKCLFLDIDLKGGESGYASAQEAVDALAKFLAETGMPKPTMIVSSGGGYHVYWTLMRALTPEEWAPLAFALAEATKRHGLKCDTQCTIDSARVLRIPDTFNCKQEPKRPVSIVGTPLDFDYAIERIEKALEPYKNPAITPPPLPALAPLKNVNDDLSAGVEVTRVGPVDIKPVLKECPFLVEALRTGGKDYANPLWNLTTFLSTFCEDGRTLAHMMARGHPGYSRESTDELFDRKEREKEQKNLGWPSCAKISAEGSKQCQGCPNFTKGKSPLNFGRPAPTPNVVPQQAQLPPADQSDMPRGYTRLPSGIICMRVENKELGLTDDVPISAYPMLDPWIEAGADDYILHFNSKTNKGKPTKIHIPCSMIGTAEMRPYLQKQLFMLPVGPKRSESFGAFMSAWITQLQETRDAVSLAAFGWNTDKSTGKLEGFVYGGNLWTPSGPKPSPTKQGNVFKFYSPAGEITKWKDAVKLITDQKRPALEAIVAASFAAPLVRFGGHTGVLLSAYSTESGLGKSTAMKVAQAIWGDPVRGIQMLDDTQNAAVNIMSELRSLPLLWDELKTEEDSRKMVNVIYRLTYGRDKNRMTSKISLQDAKTFETLLISASNDSLMEFAEQNMKISDATFLRIFEYAVEPSTGGGQIDPSRASRMTAALHSNYGHVGLEYAQWLGANFAQIDVEVGDFIEQINQRTNAKNEERFWTTLIGVVVMGAKYAKQLDFADFDVPAIEQFMLDTLQELRDRRDRRPGDLTKKLNGQSVLEDYLNAMRVRHTLYTNRINQGAGKPAHGSIRPTRDTSKLDAIYVQVGEEDKVIRIHNQHFRQWLADKGLPVHKTMQLLEQKFTIKTVVGVLGAGTEFAGAGIKINLKQIDLAGSGLDLL